MMTYEDIASRLKLSANYVRDKLVKRSGFPRPAVELSQKLRYWDEADFDKWLQSEKKKMSR